MAHGHRRPSHRGLHRVAPRPLRRARAPRDGSRGARARLPDRRAKRRRHALDARRLYRRSSGVELGSGFGYSAYWFAKATGAEGEIHLTDGDAANERKAADYLGRAGAWERITYHVGDALTSFAAVDGDFDVIYDDIDKHGYPDAWRAARDRVRIGGLYICDNTLWYGRVPPDGEPPDDLTDAIREHNAMVAADDRYVTTILPIRDGVLVALRTS